MKGNDIRKAVVAGQFYPASALELKREIESFIDKKAEKINAIACMLPHAGYAYSGSVAAQTLSGVNIKERIILLGPNHTGLGAAFSIMSRGSWQTPLGDVQIDADLAGEILGKSKYLQDEPLAHLEEHSLEVELPLLQYLKKDFKIVPIAFLSDDILALKEIGNEIAEVIKRLNIKDSTLILASSDMTHYEPQGSAEKKDREAIEAILELNENKLWERVRRLGISMCGYAPVIVMIAIAKSLDARHAKLIKYATSGDATGDRSSVVGYAGITIS